MNQDLTAAASTAVDERVRQYSRIIIGIDPGTNVMGYGVLGVNGDKPELVTMGVLKLSRFESHYLRLRRIYERVTGLVSQYLPDEMAIEAPFCGKNVQAMLKLGRAQGVAMVAALNRDIPITEYEPRKIKLEITGNGAAAKEQVAEMVKRELNISAGDMPVFLDATDALAAALCHFYEGRKPAALAATPHHAHVSQKASWANFVARNPDKVVKK